VNSPIAQRAVSALIFSFIMLVIFYVILRVLGFTVSPFISFWICVPIASVFVFTFVANEHTFASAHVIFKSYLMNRSNIKIIAVFLLIFLLWGMSRSIADWLVSPNYVGDPCKLFDDLYDNNATCGVEDLNNLKRDKLTALIDKFASVLFVLLPFSLMNHRIHFWITGR
jgi:hypothetical protein